MSHTHTPRSEFIERLESQIGAEVRRRNRMPDKPSWWMLSPLKMVVAAGILAVISMAIGGAVVSAAYQAQSNERRDVLASGYLQRVQLAQKKLDLANIELKDAELRVQMGVAPQQEALDARLKVTAVAGELKILQLQLEEIRLTGNEPLDVASAPVIGGRDFVSERLNAGLSLPQTALQVEDRRLILAQQRVAVGAADPSEVGLTQSRIQELKLAIDTIYKKIEIRKQLLNKTIDKTRADLLVLEADATRKVAAIKLNLAAAEKEREQVALKVQTGMAQNVEVVRVDAKVADLRAQLAAAQLELVLIQEKLKGKD